MAYLAKGRKEDLRNLAEELGEHTTTEMKIIDLKKIITESKSYEEELVKGMLETIINIRLETEKKEESERREQMEFEMKKLEVEAHNRGTLAPIPSDNGQHRIDLIRLMPRFNVKEDDIVIYLSLFERQAKRAKICVKEWVSYLLTLLPSEIVQLIGRESEENFEDYEYIKTILLKRFKMNPESFRKKFVMHQKTAEKSWRDFSYEITSYFEEWIGGLDVKDFEGLKKLMIADQLKKRIPYEAREHLLDEWAKFICPTQLADRLDEYDSVRVASRKSSGAVPKDKIAEKFRPRSPPIGRTSDDKSSSSVQNQPNWNPQRRNFNITKPNFKQTCFTCGKEGHISKFCNKDRQFKNTHAAQNNSVKTANITIDKKSEVLTAEISVPVSKSRELYQNIDDLKIVKVKCGKKILKGIVDTGAQISVVRGDLVANVPYDGESKIEISSAFGENETTPLRVFEMEIDDDVHGKVPVPCAVSERLVHDLLLSASAYDSLIESIELHKCNYLWETPPIETTDLNCETMDYKSDDVPEEITSAVLVMNTNGTEESLKVENSLGESCIDFGQLQRNDESLQRCFEWAEKKENSFSFNNGILVHNEHVCGENIKQVVLPQEKREGVLKMAHEIPLAGHLGEKKTIQRIKYSFYWPNILKDVKKYCESCKECQLKRTATYRDRIPIQPIVRPENPFEVWSVDYIGPLEPPSGRGHRFALCAVDLCTRWAEAIPVKDISAKTTCNVLMKIFTQTGFPKVICTDQGTNFTSKLTKAFEELLGVSPRFSTPGHPESMGAVERWNRTLKEMMNKNIQEHGRNWDLHLPYLLFAYREVPHSTTGLSPFQLVYGRLPQGPLSLLKEIWTGTRKIPIAPSRTIEDYLSNLIENLRKAHEIASTTSEKAQDRYTSRYNLRAKEKTFTVGEKVLVLVPSSTHKLLNTWIGPATIIELTRAHSARVELEDGSIKELHINKLRPYIQRVNHVGMIFELDEDFGTLHYAPADKMCKTIEDVRKHLKNIAHTLTSEQKQELFDVLQNYIDVFSSKPGHAKVEGHSVKVTENCSPKRLQPYRVPISLRKEVDRQISELLEMGLIEPSTSEWAHPVVCVAKKNGSVRLCIDFRLLNSFTISDAYPMKIARDLLFEIGQARIITVLDLTKGYWQIPIEKDSKLFTAFVTHSGHYQWNVLPFGLKNAGSTFQKSMDNALAPHQAYCRAYIDDLAIFSNTWLEHLSHINEVFKTLRSLGLTVNLDKCEFGKSEVKFLGHVVGSGRHSPDTEKVEVIKKLAKPTTKKEVRSLLGLASYYREYIPQFSRIVLPITNLTKKNVPNQIPWNTEAEEAFTKLKKELCNMPSLHTPDLEKPFQLYTDASATAIGACLAQNNDKGKEMPISFFSKKLNSCQMKWSTIEREAFCVLEALKKFDTWIFGAQIEVISDHNPLTFLTKSTPHGAKLSRWALALQRYNVKITYRKGSQHGNADALSRLKFETVN